MTDLRTDPELFFSQSPPHKAEVQTSSLGTRTRVGWKQVVSVTLGVSDPLVFLEICFPQLSRSNSQPPIRVEPELQLCFWRAMHEAWPSSLPWHRALWPGWGVWRVWSECTLIPYGQMAVVASGC